MSVKHLPLALPQACEIHLQLIGEAGLGDISLASNLREACVAQSQVLVVANGYATRVLARVGDETEWQDIGQESLEEIPLRKKLNVIRNQKNS